MLDLTIQRILHHSDMTTTQKAYIKPLDRQVTASMERMEQEIGGSDLSHWKQKSKRRKRLTDAGLGLISLIIH